MTRNGIIIRETVESDLRQIYTLGMDEPLLKNACLSFCAENLAELFASENVIALTACRGKKIFGFMFALIAGSKCVIKWFLVINSKRKTGIGTNMLHSCYKNAKNCGVENFFIALFPDNSESVNFFSKKGFTVTKTCIELYSNSDENI